MTLRTNAPGTRPRSAGISGHKGGGAIERLQAENAALKEALLPFAAIEVPTNAPDGTWVAQTIYCCNQVTAYSVRKARAALGGEHG